MMSRLGVCRIGYAAACLGGGSAARATAGPPARPGESAVLRCLFLAGVAGLIVHSTLDTTVRG